MLIPSTRSLSASPLSIPSPSRLPSSLRSPSPSPHSIHFVGLSRLPVPPRLQPPDPTLQPLPRPIRHPYTPSSMRRLHITSFLRRPRDSPLLMTPLASSLRPSATRTSAKTAPPTSQPPSASRRVSLLTARAIVFITTTSTRAGFPKPRRKTARTSGLRTSASTSTFSGSPPAATARVRRTEMRTDPSTPLMPPRRARIATRQRVAYAEFFLRRPQRASSASFSLLLRCLTGYYPLRCSCKYLGSTSPLPYEANSIGWSFPRLPPSRALP